MLGSMRFLLTISSILFMSLASQGFSSGGGGGPNETVETKKTGRTGFSNAVTSRAVKLLRDGFDRCQRVETVYRFDCYRQTYRSATKYLAGRQAYAGALEALQEVEKVLDQIMAKNVDTSKRSVRKGLQTYKPIKPAAVPRAKADLGRALDRAETKLLRAPERSRSDYARIAAAVNSNKVLLRSRLYPDADILFQTAFA
jgi:hypothetical protein